MLELWYLVFIARPQKNEVFLDVTESMSLLVNSSGQVVHSEVTGALKMRCFLSGMVSRAAFARAFSSPYSIAAGMQAWAERQDDDGSTRKGWEGQGC